MTRIIQRKTEYKLIGWRQNGTVITDPEGINVEIHHQHVPEHDNF